MPQYHLYFISQGRLVDADDVEAPDDGEALRLAQQRRDGDVVEVWDDDSHFRVLAAACS